jgi:hypothetical protein
MMEVQKFIKERGWNALKEELFIEVREYDNGLRVLNYSMIESPKMHPVVMECRALKLDSDANIVSRAFNRFFNYGEADTLDFDFSNCTVWEKADGSLCPVYWCPQTNRWEISTRGTGFAEANHVWGTKTNCTFREAILEAMQLTEDQFQSAMLTFPTDSTYVMEYISPFNRIVTPYPEPKMVLLAIVCLDGWEEPPGALRHYCDRFNNVGMNVRMPKTYQVKNGDELRALAESLDNLQEGFVVQDYNTSKRIKCKSSHYVLVHQMRGNGAPTMNNLLELVAKNEQDELLAYFPEYKQFIEPVEMAMAELLETAAVVYDATKHLETQKDFALAVKDSMTAPVLFRARKDGVTPEHAYKSMEVSQRVKLLERFV